MTDEHAKQIEQAEKVAGEAVSNFYLAMSVLKRTGEHRKAYDAMGALLTMLTEDRKELQEKHKIVS